MSVSLPVSIVQVRTPGRFTHRNVTHCLGKKLVQCRHGLGQEKEGDDWTDAKGEEGKWRRNKEKTIEQKEKYSENEE